MVAKKIVLFNHKGGVSKTTTTLNLGWMLAEKGKKVLLADFDPQCNLTGMILDFRGADELMKLYQNNKNSNIKDGLSPAFESRPSPIEPVECIAVPGQPRLYLLAGHIGLSEYEVTLGIAQSLSGSIQALQNLPGSINALLSKTAESIDVDYVLIDTSPSLSSLNRNLLMTCDYFLIPCSPDFYSVMAIDSLAEIFPNWYRWASEASGLEVLQKASYPFPSPHPKFLGVIVQKYRPRIGTSPAREFQNWIDEIDSHVTKTLVPTLAKSNMMLSSEKYEQIGVSSNYSLASIPDFNSLIAASQRTQKPVFALTDEEIGLTGVVLERTVATKENFRRIFSDFADMVIKLTTDE